MSVSNFKNMGFRVINKEVHLSRGKRYFYLKVGVTVVVLVWLINIIDLKEVRQLLTQVKLGYFLGAAGVLIAINMVLAARWKVLLDVGENRLSWFKLLQLYLVGGFFNAFLPTGLGGDVMRIWLSGNTNKNHTGAFAAVAVERLLGMAGTVGIVLIGGWMYLGSVNGYDLRAVIVGIGAAVLLSLMLILHPGLYNKIISLSAKIHLFRLGELLSKVFNALHSYRYSMWRLGVGFILSFIVQFLFVVLHFFIGEAFTGIDKLSIQPYFLISPMIGLGNFLPSVGGYGIREGSYVLLLSIFGISKDLGFSYAVLADILIFLFVSIGGIVFLMLKRNDGLPSVPKKEHRFLSATMGLFLREP